MVFVHVFRPCVVLSAYLSVICGKDGVSYVKVKRFCPGSLTENLLQQVLVGLFLHFHFFLVEEELSSV